MRKINIRVGVAIDSDGNWNATGWSCDKLSGPKQKIQEREFLDNAAEFIEMGFPITKELILCASVELPDQTVDEVEAEVENPS